MLSTPRKTDTYFRLTINGDENFALGSYNIYFTVRAKITSHTTNSDTQALISKVETINVTTVTGNFEVVFALNRDETNIPIGNYEYDVKVLTPADELIQTNVGILTITKDVTRQDV